jgi:glycosyltransferase involved in cell wall biosynthesis
MPLRIAGKCREPFELQYFDAYVRPELDESIVYLGEVTHADKVELLQRARATVFPIEWEEPFGLVMIESLACGTPVIATQRGSVPEVLDDGVTGIVVEDYRAMVDALHRVDELDPHVLRRTVKERFAPERMVGDYVAVYERAIELDRR